ncbi:MAG: sulfatase, partial [Kiritimatiellia bacterium]
MNNIVFIMMDQWRYDAMGCMGKFPVKTPNIDRLVDGGTMFQNTYCSNPVCVPARASLMTGLYSYDHGVYYNDQNFPERLATLPGRLSANGYYAVHIGKKHIHPEHRAIGFNKLVLKAGDPLKRRLKKRAAGAQADSWHKAEVLAKGYPVQPTDGKLEDYEPVQCTENALHELDLLAERRECRPGGNEPFFMKVSYSRPHSPCNPPEPYFSMYRPEDLPPPAANETEIARFSSQMKKWYDIWSKLDADRALKHRAQYFGCVTLVDEQIGRILRRLQELQLDENTLIVLTADHGDHLCDHHVQQKAFFYDSSARVPFIFNGPGVSAGRRVRENVSHIDLFPTLLDYCDLAMPRLRDPAGRLIYADQCETDAM